jgi:hypothetical protein
VGRRRLSFPNGVEILPACLARSGFLSPGTSYLLGEHDRKPEKLFYLSTEANAVGMTTFTDVGMKITVISQIIENICHHFRFDAAERDLTLIVSVASEVRDRYHVISPSRLNPLLIPPDAKGKIAICA